MDNRHKNKIEYKNRGYPKNIAIPVLSEGSLPTNLDQSRIIGSRNILSTFPGFSGKKVSLRSTRSLIWSVTPKKILLHSLLLSVGFIFATSSIPIFLHWAIDKAIIPHSFSHLWMITTGTCCLALGSALSFSMFVRLTAFRRLTVSYLVSTAISEQSMRLGRSLKSKISTGEAISVGASDVQRMTAMTMLLTRVAGLIFGSIYGFVLLLQINVIYGLIALGSNVLTIVAITPFLWIIHHRQHAYRKAEAEQTGRSGDIVSGLRILAGIGGMDVFNETFTESANRTRDAKLKASMPWLAVTTIVMGVSTIMVSIITYLAYEQVTLHHFSIGAYSQANAQAAAYAGNIWTYIEIFLLSINGRVSAQRILAFLRLQPDIIDDTHTVPAPIVASDIYDEKSGITIQTGELTVIISEELGIATALARRLARVIPQVDGVLWGGIPLRTIPLQQIRQRIVFSDNDDHLFTGTLLSNITMGREFPSEEIDRAMYTSACDELLEILDNGLQSYIREKALNLSGGQRQRVRLARALLFNPEILLLIDPTSAVDAHVEMIIAKRLAIYRKENPEFTTVIISNSPHIAAQADRIIILDKAGKLCEGGLREDITNTAVFRKIVYRNEHNFEDDDVSQIDSLVKEMNVL